MAQTQEQWFHKISTFLPTWYFDKGPDSDRVDTTAPYFETIIWALAKIASEMETEIYTQFAQTYIDTAVAEVLDLHASERGVERFTGETDASLRPRIKAFGETFSIDYFRDAIEGIIDDTYVEYTLKELESDGPWLGVDDIFMPEWATSYRKQYNRGLVELLPKKTTVTSNTTILPGEELEACWLVVAEGVTLTVQGTLSASFVGGPGTVTNSGGTIQTFADYDSYVAANKASIYSQIEDFLLNNKALGVFVAVQSYLEGGLV